MTRNSNNAFRGAVKDARFYYETALLGNDIMKIWD